MQFIKFFSNCHKSPKKNSIKLKNIHVIWMHNPAPFKPCCAMVSTYLQCCFAVMEIPDF